MKLALICACLFGAALAGSVAPPEPKSADAVAQAESTLLGSLAQAATKAEEGLAKSTAIAKGLKDNVAAAVSKIEEDGSSKAQGAAKTLGAAAGADSEVLKRSARAAQPPAPMPLVSVLGPIY